MTTKGGGTTGQSQIYLWRRKVGELDDAPKPTNLNEHERAVFEAKVADSGRLFLDSDKPRGLYRRSNKPWQMLKSTADAQRMVRKGKMQGGY